MNAPNVNVLKEIRLILCGWCFLLALWIAPKHDDAEGLIIMEAIYGWADKTTEYLKHNKRSKYNGK